MIDTVYSIPFNRLEAAPSGDRAKRSSAPLIDEFVGDADNVLPRHAVESVLISPPVYNPLLIYGPSGVGKSHLGRGMARLWQEQYPSRRLLVTTGSDFTKAYRTAYDSDALTSFRKRMRGMHFFFLDNLEQLGPKPAVQHELLTTIDELLDRESHVMVASREFPNNLPDLLPAIASRLCGGLTVPVGAPGPAARRAILAQLAERHGVELSDDALHLLADELRPPLQNALTFPLLNNVVLQLATGANKSPSLTDVRQLLDQNRQENAPTLRAITAAVCHYYQVKAGDVRGPQRRSQIVRSRGVAMLLARQLTGKTYQQIGKYFSGRDHTTVMNACRRIEKLCETDRAMRTACDEIRDHLIGK